MLIALNENDERIFIDAINSQSSEELFNDKLEDLCNGNREKHRQLMNWLARYDRNIKY